MIFICYLSIIKYGANPPYFILLKGVFDMGRSRGSKSRDKNKASLPQTPKNMKYDRMSEEYAAELNNQVSLEEQAWANAANQRVQGSKK